MNPRIIESIQKKTTELSEMKQLRGKHFTRRDRNTLNKEIVSFGKLIKKVLDSNLELEKSKIEKLMESNVELEKLLKIVDEYTIELDEKYKYLNKELKDVLGLAEELSNKRTNLMNKITKIKSAIAEKNKGVTFLKNQKKRV